MLKYYEANILILPSLIVLPCRYKEKFRISFHFFFFWLHPVACWILVPQPDFEPRPRQ